MPRCRLPWIVVGPQPLPDGTGNAFRVERLGDRARRFAGGIVVENAPDDGRLCRVDLALAAHRLAVPASSRPHHIIAVAIAAAGFPASTRPRRPRRVLSARSLRNSAPIVPLRPICSSLIVAFGEGDDPHAGKAQPLEDRGDVCLIAGEPVQRFGYDDIEVSRARIAASAPGCRGASGSRRKSRDRCSGSTTCQPFALRRCFAKPELIFDRGFALHVGGVAGVNDGCAHRESFVPPLRREGAFRVLRDALSSSSAQPCARVRTNSSNRSSTICVSG